MPNIRAKIHLRMLHLSRQGAPALNFQQSLQLPFAFCFQHSDRRRRDFKERITTAMSHVNGFQQVSLTWPGQLFEIQEHKSLPSGLNQGMEYGDCRV